jgi:hypothetical protein
MPRIMRVQPAELPWDPRTMDVICDQRPVYAGPGWDPQPSRRRCNITQELFPGGHVGLSWGDGSPGSYCLALCALDRHLPWTPGDVASWRGGPLPCSPLAVQLADRFWAEAVRPLPWEGGTIQGAWIRAWIDRELERRPDLAVHIG